VMPNETSARIIVEADQFVVLGTQEPLYLHPKSEIRTTAIVVRSVLPYSLDFGKHSAL
jgi:hypothetical protein